METIEFYSINEVAKLLNLPVTAIRSLANVFHLEAYKRKNGDILITKASVERLSVSANGSWIRFNVQDYDAAKQQARDLAAYAQKKNLPAFTVTLLGNDGGVSTLQYKPANAQPVVVTDGGYICWHSPEYRKDLERMFKELEIKNISLRPSPGVPHVDGKPIRSDEGPYVTVGKPDNSKPVNDQ